MEPLIGVTTHVPYMSRASSADLKRYLLIADLIFFVVSTPSPPYLEEEFLADLEWLESKGVVYRPPHDPEPGAPITKDARLGFTPHPDLTQVVMDLMTRKADLVSVAMSLSPLDFSRVILAISDLTSRNTAELLRRRGHDAVSIHPEFPHVPEILSTPTKFAEVAQVSIDAMPQPAETVPLDQLLRFKQDPDTKTKFSALRRWIRSAAAGTTKPNELTDELHGLTEEYEEHMRVHELKINRGTLETLVTTSAEILEDTLKLRFGKLSRLPFSLSHRKIALLEAELNAPGREIAYIVKARKEFH